MAYKSTSFMTFLFLSVTFQCLSLGWNVSSSSMLNNDTQAIYFLTHFHGMSFCSLSNVFTNVTCSKILAPQFSLPA